MDIENIEKAEGLIDEWRCITRVMNPLTSGRCSINVGVNSSVPEWNLTDPRTQECLKEALVKRKQQIEEELAKL